MCFFNRAFALCRLVFFSHLFLYGVCLNHKITCWFKLWRGGKKSLRLFKCVLNLRFKVFFEFKAYASNKHFKCALRASFGHGRQVTAKTPVESKSVPKSTIKPESGFLAKTLRKNLGLKHVCCLVKQKQRF